MKQISTGSCNSHSKTSFLVLLLFLQFAPLCLSDPDMIIYVDASATVSGDGSQNLPFNTLSSAFLQITTGSPGTLQYTNPYISITPSTKPLVFPSATLNGPLTSSLTISSISSITIGPDFTKAECSVLPTVQITTSNLISISKIGSLTIHGVSLRPLASTGSTYMTLTDMSQLTLNNVCILEDDTTLPFPTIISAIGVNMVTMGSIFFSKVFPSTFISSDAQLVNLQAIQVMQALDNSITDFSTPILSFSATNSSSNLTLSQMIIQSESQPIATYQLQILNLSKYYSLTLNNFSLTDSFLNITTNMFQIQSVQTVSISDFTLSNLKINSKGLSLFDFSKISFISTHNVLISNVISLFDLAFIQLWGIEATDLFIFLINDFDTAIGNSSLTNITIRDSDLAYITVLQVVGNFSNFNLDMIEARNSTFRYRTFMFFKTYLFDSMKYEYVESMYWNSSNFHMDNCTFMDGRFLYYAYISDSRLQAVLVIGQPDVVMFSNISITNSLFSKDDEGTVTYYSYLISSSGYQFEIENFTFSHNDLYQYTLFYVSDRLASILITDSVFTNNSLQSSIFLMLNFAGLQVPLITFAYFNVADKTIYPQYIILYFSNCRVSDLRMNEDARTSAIISAASPFVFIEGSTFENITSHTGRIIDIGLFSPIPTDDVYSTYVRNTTMEKHFFPHHPQVLELFDNSTYDVDDSGLGIAYQYHFRNNTFKDNFIVSTHSPIRIQGLTHKTSGIMIEGNTFIHADLGKELGVNFLWFIFDGHIEIKNNAFVDCAGTGYMIAIEAMVDPLFVNVSNNSISRHSAAGFFVHRPESIKTFVFQDNTLSNSVLNFTFLQVIPTTNRKLILIQRNTFRDVTVYSSSVSSFRINLILIQVQLIAEGSKVSFLENVFQNIQFDKRDPYLKGNYENSLISVAVGSSYLEIINCTFGHTFVRNEGSYITITAGAVLMSNVRFQNISTNGLQGSIYLLSPNITIINSEFIENHGYDDVIGGVLYVDYDRSFKVDAITLSITNSTFNFNSALKRGGVLYVEYTGLRLTLDNNTFRDNYSVDQAAAIEFVEVDFLELNIKNNKFRATNYSVNYPRQDWIKFTNVTGTGVLSNSNITFNGDASIDLISIEASPSFILNVTNAAVAQRTPITSRLLADEAQISLYRHFTLVSMSSGVVNLKNISLTNLIVARQPLINMKCSNQTSSISMYDSEIYNVSQKAITSSNRFQGVVNKTETLQIATPGGIFLTDPLESVENCTTLIEINNSSFSLISQDGSGGVINDLTSGSTHIILTNSNFSNVTAAQGGAISTFSSSNDAYIKVENCSFENNTVFGYGGVIFNMAAHLDIRNSSFRSNTAGYSGGAIYSYTFGNLPQIATNSSNIFENNTFIKKGGSNFGARARALYVDFTPESYTNTGMIKSVDNQTDSWLTRQINVTNVTSYTLQSAMFQIMIFDELGQLIQDISTDATVYLNILLTQGTKSFTSNNCSSVDCSTTNCYLPSDNNSSLPIQPTGNITICFINDKNIIMNGFKFTSSINIMYRSRDITLNSTIWATTRECKKGEVINRNENTCELCQPGKYSFVPEDGYCKPCPVGGNCTGGSTIVVQEGYWRENNSTDSILACPNSGNTNRCLGTENSICNTGFIGPLCHQCDLENGYIRQGTDTVLACNQCSATWIVYLLNFLFFIGKFAYQIYFISNAITTNRQYLKAIKENLPLPVVTGPYVRIITTYIQVILIVSSFNAGFLKFLGVDTVFGGDTITELGFHDCLFVVLGFKAENQLKAKILFSLIFLFAKMIIVCLVYLVKWNFALVQKRRARLIVVGLSFFILEQPDIVQLLMSYLSCVKLNPNSDQTYVYRNEFFECGTRDYNFFSYFLVIPISIYFTFFLTAFLTYNLWKKRKELNHEFTRVTLGVLYNEFNPETYYWGMLIIAMKVTLIFINNIFRTNVKTKSFVLLGVLTLYNLYLQKKRPYYDPDMFKAEKFTVAAYILTVFSSALFIDNDTYIKIICLITMVVSNLIAIGFIAKKLYVISRMKIIEKIISFRKGKVQPAPIIKRIETQKSINSVDNLDEAVKEFSVVRHQTTIELPRTRTVFPTENP